MAKATEHLPALGDEICPGAAPVLVLEARAAPRAGVRAVWGSGAGLWRGRYLLRLLLLSSD